MRELANLDRVERLLQDQHAIGRAERGRHLLPGVIGIRRADHDPDVGVLLEQAHGRLNAVEARWHPHVDEQQRVRLLALAREPNLLQRLLALVRRVELEALRLHLGLGPEQLLLERAEVAAVVGRGRP